MVGDEQLGLPAEAGPVTRGSEMLHWLRIAICVGALLTIPSEVGAAEFGNPADGSATYLWSGSKQQRASAEVTPSLNSTQQKDEPTSVPSQELD